MRKTHKNGYMSYVECRMLPINAMVLVCISQLHFTQATHQSRLVRKQKYPISMVTTQNSLTFPVFCVKALTSAGFWVKFPNFSSLLIIP